MYGHCKDTTNMLQWMIRSCAAIFKPLKGGLLQQMMEVGLGHYCLSQSFYCPALMAALI